MPQRNMSEIVNRRNPVTLPPDASVKDACRLMRHRRIGAIPVTDGDGKLVGLFSGRDAVTRVLAEALDPERTCIGDVMTKRPDTLGPQARAIDALRLMQDGGFRHVPIADGEKLVGIVSFADFNGLERARLDEETGFWEIM
ncbi:MAG TPA: CBS domain-containing protein [Rhodopila sp.]|uniref:CBS domain-containing protein n=1 Tax=Rhodopila sp. TaxID=2480087 RepID=UPI002C093FB8|nr:CBS domain-containing protein [Rhodopila sp.]HVY14791.1 CBS domain-containing protein [Rhodopila sp.]